MYIIRTIKNILKNNPVLFTTPGHFQGLHTSKEFEELFGRKIFSADLAEIESMDNLHEPKEGILKSLQRTAGIYNSRASFYLVNGSSSGIIALVLTSVKRGEKILIARNAHKSVINALILSGAMPVWAETEWHDYWNIPACVKPGKIKEKLEDDPGIKAVLVTSPTYEGIVSDIKSIAEICRKKNVTLLIDEAHGALWNFSDLLPDSSIHLGADACVQSLHKTGSCLNQGAIMHLAKNSRLNPEEVQRNLNLINTTSPSYVLLASIEASIEYMNSEKGRNKLDELIKNIENTKEYLKEHSGAVFLESESQCQHDPTKMFFGLEDVDGRELSDFLQNNCNIEVELNNNRGLLALTGIGTESGHINKLIKAVIQADKTLEKNYEKPEYFPFITPKTVLSPAEAYYMEYDIIDINKAAGLISGETLVKYPPGIPIIITGEIIQQEHIKTLPDKRRIKVIKV